MVTVDGIGPAAKSREPGSRTQGSVHGGAVPGDEGLTNDRDIAAVMGLALAGTMDGRIVNVTDDAPVSVYEMTLIAGVPIPGSAEPLVNPWSGRMDGALVRELGFRPTVPTIHSAVRDGLL